jgi:hypothetical protein
MSGTTDQRPWGPRPRPSAVGSARTQSPRWRYQSWAGIVAFMASQYQPNIMLGIGERISIGAFLLWVVLSPLRCGVRQWTPLITRRRFRLQRRWPEHVNYLPETKH